MKTSNSEKHKIVENHIDVFVFMKEILFYIFQFNSNLNFRVIILYFKFTFCIHNDRNFIFISSRRQFFISKMK